MPGALPFVADRDNQADYFTAGLAEKPLNRQVLYPAFPLQIYAVARVAAMPVKALGFNTPRAFAASRAYVQRQYPC